MTDAEPDQPTGADRAIHTWLQLHVLGPSWWTPIVADLSYDPESDPYAVQLAFGSDHDDITWLFGRDLLRTGLAQPAGDGDVRLWPSRYATSALFLQLRGRTSRVMFEVDRSAVVMFLQCTDAAVPPGTESAHLSLDRLVDELIEGGGQP